MRIKAVLFDLDNTLIDFMWMKKMASKAAAKAMVKAGLESKSKDLAKELFNFYLEYGIESDDAFTKFLEKKVGIAEPRIVAAGVNAYLKEKYLHLQPYPDVVETLKKLKKKDLKLAVVTDGLRLKAWMRLNEAGLDKYFDAVVTYDDTGKKKPSKEPFTKACKQISVKPQECLMIGDWPERDIEGAKAIGMKTGLAKYGQVVGRKTSGADIELKNFQEILKYFGAQGGD